MKPSTAHQTQPHDIVVRKIPFDFNEDIDPVWNPRMPEWSHMVNGASMAMPYLEPFLIRTMREALAGETDPALKRDGQKFIAQEAHHYQNHRRYNELLKAKGYPGLAKIEDEMAAEYAQMQSKSLKWRLAYTAGFETMTMGVTEWLITNRCALFAGADPSVASLVLWHMVEETEHKTVAFDLYQSLYADYWARIWGIVCGSRHVMKLSCKAYLHMIEVDARRGAARSRLRRWKMETSFLLNIGKRLLGSMLPGHSPEKVKDPDWVAQWVDAYSDLPENHIPLLDTSHPDIPARFA